VNGKRITLMCFDALPYEELEKDLQNLQFEVHRTDRPDESIGDSGLTIVFDAETHGMMVNDEAIRLGAAWLPVQFSHMKARIGPLIVPHETPCYQCVQMRMQAGEVPKMAAKSVYFSLSFSLVCKIIALETVKWTSRETNSFVPASLGHQIVIDAFHLKGELQPVYQVPSCPVCGIPAKPESGIMPWQPAVLAR
jgi:bacteriocin biosynthesis cyclodehydratase domain-containing protein